MASGSASINGFTLTVGTLRSTGITLLPRYYDSRCGCDGFTPRLAANFAHHNGFDSLRSPLSGLPSGGSMSAALSLWSKSLQN